MIVPLYDLHRNSIGLSGKSVRNEIQEKFKSNLYFQRISILLNDVCAISVLTFYYLS